MRFLLITTTLATATAHWPLHAQDAVPASFDCAMRKAAYAYGKKLLPRMGAFEPLFYALNLNSDDCPGVLEGAKETAAPLPVPAGSIFVAPTGAARASGEPVGSAANPFDDIQAAADAAADRGVKSVVLRGGTYSCTIEPQQLRRVHRCVTARVVTGTTFGTRFSCPRATRACSSRRTRARRRRSLVAPS